MMEEETRKREQIPILGSIPLLGYFFGHTETAKSESELLLVVSPHIVHALPKGSKVQLPDATEKQTDSSK